VGDRVGKSWSVADRVGVGDRVGKSWSVADRVGVGRVWFVLDGVGVCVLVPVGRGLAGVPMPNWQITPSGVGVGVTMGVEAGCQNAFAPWPLADATMSIMGMSTQINQCLLRSIAACSFRNKNQRLRRLTPSVSISQIKSVPA
jgi:hypothetical protein